MCGKTLFTKEFEKIVNGSSLKVASLIRALGTLGQLQNLPDGPTDNPQTQTQKNKTKGGKVREEL